MEIQAKDSSAARLEQFAAALKDTEKNIRNIMNAIEQGILTPSTKDRLLELEARAEELRMHIAREKIKKPAITREHVLYWLRLFKKGDVSDPAFRERLLDVFVHSVYVYNEKVVIAYNYTDNNHSIDFNPQIFRCSDKHTLLSVPGFEPGTT